jgi:pyruvate,orthophosphate dikinase
MTSKNINTQDWSSSALETNLKKTSAYVKIPGKHKPLLKIVEGSFGRHKRTLDLLTELHHPYVNWEYVIEELKRLSLSDFFFHNSSTRGDRAISIIIDIYIDLISRKKTDTLKKKAIRYLFEYLHKILSESGKNLSRNAPLVCRTIPFLSHTSRKSPHLFRKKSKHIKDFLDSLNKLDADIPWKDMKELLHQVFKETYIFWLDQPDPKCWMDNFLEDSKALAEFKTLISPISHDNIRGFADELELTHRSVKDMTASSFSPYLRLPDHHQILNGYLITADEMEKSEILKGRQHFTRLHFLLKIISCPDLADIHKRALIETNRSLHKVFAEKNHRELNGFIKNMFLLLKKSDVRFKYPDTLLNCILTVAKQVFKLGNHKLADNFLKEIIQFGFQNPNILGATQEWEVKANPVHIKNIRIWMEIIAMNPRWSKKLLSALIINLHLGGIFVRDTDLLQKDISALLNSEITPAYNLVLQLARLFPIYYNEIGAEGELREISTEMDEVSSRNDKLIHFLRKQSHVESNSSMVSFVENIFRFWSTGEKKLIKNYVPPEVYEQITNSGEYFDAMHRIFQKIFLKTDGEFKEILKWDKPKIQKILQIFSNVPNRDKERAILIIRFYQLIYKKYKINHTFLIKDLESCSFLDQAKIRSLKRYLQRKEFYKALDIILDFLAALNKRILSPEKTPATENIYHKRHIAAGIPSMYGTYNEAKFEALGLTFRLQSLGNVLFEQAISQLNYQFITKSMLRKSNTHLWLFIKALRIEGVSTEGLEFKMKYYDNALQVNLFTIDQYIDIFRFLSKGIQDIIRDYYIDAHQANLAVIIPQYLEKEPSILLRDNAETPEEVLYRISENLIRSMISSAFGLQTLDNFISKIIKTLSIENEKFKDHKHMLDILMTYNPEITVVPIYKKMTTLNNQIHLGNKGYFLKKMACSDFPIPPGFIITTEVFRCLDAVLGHEYITKDLNGRIDAEIKHLTRKTGKELGNPKNPLLLSVRSGAAISLPGMMNSFLNVGINEKIAEGLSQKKGFSWAAWDSYRRFLQVWGMFEGLNRDSFDAIILHYKEKYNISKKLEFSPSQMKQIALAYKQELLYHNIDVIEDPREQLRIATLKVFESWHSQHAMIYRHEMNISDEWGTAVIVQAMIYGNLNTKSGSGVVFTRNPKGLSSSVHLIGDYIYGVQGDDIVSGLVETNPVSIRQCKIEKRRSETSLEKRFPLVYSKLKYFAKVLIYDVGLDHQEIEFTFENETPDGLYILQTRDMLPIESVKLRPFVKSTQLKKSLIGTGIGISGGALSGRVVFSKNEINYHRKQDPKTPLILIRPDTVPEDISLIRQADGLLTARGGSTSHAAVTIPQLKKTGVVGLKDMRVHEKEKYIEINRHKIRSGDYVSIDGWSGSVYLGKHAIEPEATFRIKI